VGDEPGGRQRRAGLPVKGEAILVREWGSGARIPLTVQFAGEDGEGTGQLVGERL
jgi:hypothetical protein